MDLPLLKKSVAIGLVCDKGGVSKTTTALHLASWLAKISHRHEYGWRVLLVDMDPQATAASTLSCQPEPPALEQSLGRLLVDTKADPLSFPRSSPWRPETLFYIPSSPETMETAIPALLRMPNADLRLRALAAKLSAAYQVIIFDSGGRVSDLLVRNVGFASTHLIIPANADWFGYEGLSRTVRWQADIGDSLAGLGLTPPQLLGVLLSHVRTNVGNSEETISRTRALLGDAVFETMIPFTIMFADAISRGQDVFSFGVSSPAAKAVNQLGLEVLQRVVQSQA